MLREIVQGGQDSHRAEQAGDGIGNGIAEVQRPSVFLAADLREAAHRLEDPGEAWPPGIGTVLAEPGDPQDGEARIEALQPGSRDAPAVERARAEVLDQHVGVGHQPGKEIAAFGHAKIERDALLVAVGDLPPQRHAVLVRRQRAQRVADARHLDLDDLGAIVAQQTRRERAGHDRRDVDDAQTLERAGGFRLIGLHRAFPRGRKSGRCACEAVKAAKPALRDREGRQDAAKAGTVMTGGNT